jgi:hypothetical protein
MPNGGWGSAPKPPADDDRLPASRGEYRDPRLFLSRGVASTRWPMAASTTSSAAGPPLLTDVAGPAFRADAHDNAQSPGSTSTWWERREPRYRDRRSTTSSARVPATTRRSRPGRRHGRRGRRHVRLRAEVREFPATRRRSRRLRRHG